MRIYSYSNSGTNHLLHAILTLFTCGMWAPVWLLIAIFSKKSSHSMTYMPEQQHYPYYPQHNYYNNYPQQRSPYNQQPPNYP